MYFVDTNIFIYYLFPVDLAKHSSCVELFKRAENGEVALWTNEWTVAELIWFMRRKKKTWSEIKRFIMEGLIRGRQVKVKNEKLITNVVEKCKKDSDFVDYMNMYLLRSDAITKGYSYNKDLDRWKGFKRLEPQLVNSSSFARGFGGIA